MSALDKKSLKQFELKDKESCILYLLRIIGTIDLCLYRLKKYNNELKEVVERSNNDKVDKISYDLYSELLDKTSNNQNYLLNIIGDAQKTSISYFKYRKQAERLIKAGVNDIRLSPLSQELESHLNEFNKLRNWQNHVPESLLTSEISLVEEDKLLDPSRNPIEVYFYKYVSIEYFEDLYITSINFYEISRKIHQSAKRDYSLLINESIEIKRIFTDKVRTIDNNFNAAKKSAKIQGLKSEECNL